MSFTSLKLDSEALQPYPRTIV